MTPATLKHSAQPYISRVFWGDNATAGAIGGFIASAGAKQFAQALYGKKVDQLNPDEKMVILNLVSAVGAVGGGVATGNTNGMVSAGNAARVEVENNYLSATEADKKAVLERKEKAETLTADEAKELADTRKLDKDRDQAIRDICTQGNKSGGACSALVAQAQQALNTYGGNVTYNLIYKDLYPQDAANASAILKGLDEGSITRDAVITAIAKATGKGWDGVAAQYDRVMQLHRMVSSLAGLYGANWISEAESQLAKNSSENIRDGAG